MKTHIFLIMLAGIICTGCCSLFCEYRPGDDIEVCNIKGNVDTCITITLP